MPEGQSAKLKAEHEDRGQMMWSHVAEKTGPGADRGSGDQAERSSCGTPSLIGSSPPRSQAGAGLEACSFPLPSCQG